LGGDVHASAEVRTVVYFKNRFTVGGLPPPIPGAPAGFSSVPNPTAVRDTPGPGAVKASFTGKSFEGVERTTMPISPPAVSKLLIEYEEGYKKFCR
jgi:hypothetical protein